MQISLCCDYIVKLFGNNQVIDLRHIVNKKSVSNAKTHLPYYPLVASAFVYIKKEKKITELIIIFSIKIII